MPKEKNRGGAPPKGEMKSIFIKNPLDHPVIDDFIGSDDLKKELGMIVKRISYPGLYDILGIDPPKVYMFYGPPGNGKTFGVDVIYNEIWKERQSVGMAMYDIGHQGSPYINQNAVNLQDFFDMSRTLVNSNRGYDAMMLVFDECDVLFAPRGGWSGKEDDKLLETMMKNLQRIHSAREKLYCFLMTNFEKHMDVAAIRSERVDRRLHFPNPDLPQLVQAYITKMKAANDRAHFDLFCVYDHYSLAKASEGFNLADIEHIVNASIGNTADRLYDIKNECDITTEISIRQEEVMKVIEQTREQYHQEKRMGFK